MKQFKPTMNCQGLTTKLFVALSCVAFVFAKTGTFNLNCTILLDFKPFLYYLIFAGPTHSKVVACYVATWAATRPSKGAYTIENINPNLCTNVIYSFAGLNHATSEIRSLGKENL